MLNTTYTMSVDFSVTVSVLTVLIYLLVGFVSTMWLWSDAGLFGNRKALKNGGLNLAVLTIICILFPPLPLYMLWRDKLVQRLFYRMFRFRRKMK